MTSLGRLVFADIHSRHHLLDALGISNRNESLSLAYENLFDMPFDVIENYGNKIHTLDISHNNFCRSLHFLAEFENLQSLILDNNNIDGISTFPEIPKMQILWLNNNKIEELYPFLKNLHKSFPNLKFLSLMGNKAAPSFFNGGNFYDYLQYRLFVISWFPHLEHLDDRPVTPEERIEAKRLFKRPIVERIVEYVPFPECMKHVNSKLAALLMTPISLPNKLKFTRRSNSII